MCKDTKAGSIHNSSNCKRLKRLPTDEWIEEVCPCHRIWLAIKGVKGVKCNVATWINLKMLFKVKDSKDHILHNGSRTERPADCKLVVVCGGKVTLYIRTAMSRRENVLQVR